MTNLNEFQPEQETFSVYAERFEFFAAANSVDDAKKVPLFLTVLRGSAYMESVCPENLRQVMRHYCEAEEPAPFDHSTVSL